MLEETHAVQTLRTPALAGRGATIGMLVAAVVWSLGAALDRLPLPPGAGMICVGLTWAAIIALPGFWLLFAWQYVRGEIKPVPLAWRLPHSVLLLLTVLLAVTNPRHHLIADGVAHGPWFFIASTYVYGLMLVSAAMIIEAIQRSRSFQRRHYLAIAACMAIPGLANFYSASGLRRPFGLDPTPIAFLAATAVILWLLSRQRLFNLAPIARSVLMEAMPDPMLVLDLSHRVTDANGSAFALVGLTEPLIGRPLTEVACLAPLRAIATGEGPPVEVTLGPDRQFEVTLVPLAYGDRQVGRLLLLRDITRRAHLELRLREQATRDSLTGLHNRRLLDEVGRRLIHDADQRGQPLAVIMVDLDHFKRLNDHHGHHAGDRVLETIGRFLSERVRQTDFVFRTGGEEILILLPGATAHQALARIDGWRREFAATEIAIGAETRVQSTFSAGVAVYPDDGTDLEQLMHRADMALYDAKQQGRNRACLWSPTLPAATASSRPPLTKGADWPI